jgi:ubiquinone/menaquinone biosynthesis C-methylase UbiE
MDFHPVFFELHSELEQEAPGSDTSTLKAFASLPPLPEGAKILDIGCGPGRQTLALARHTQAEITALDFHQPYLDQLSERVKSENLQSSVITKHGSMDKLDFQEKSFDLIWSEGALYIMGVEAALNYLKTFLKDSGYLVFSELCLFTDSPSAEVLSFFQSAYPAVKTVDQNLEMIKKAKYKVIDHFKLPESDWLDGYYAPLAKRLEMLKQKYSMDNEALATLEEDQKEIDFYKKHSEGYGYSFFVLRIDAGAA